MQTTTATSVERSISFLDELLGDLEGSGIAFRMWDGTLWGDSDPRATIVLGHPGALRAMFWPPSDLTLGEAFVYGDFDVEGDIEATFVLGDRLAPLAEGVDLRRLGKLTHSLLRLPGSSRQRRADRAARVSGAAHSKERDSDSVRYHYDVGNDFFSLWLDENMQYSCGYFCYPDDDLDAAQRAKMEHICRKLRLEPGDRLLDIGCGWGGLAAYAASTYGCEVVGVTLSPPQAELANERMSAQGVSDRARAEVLDYREVAGPFDKAVSVGMAEHVGREQLPEYFGVVADVLEPGGLFLNHAISCAWENRAPRKDTFIQKHVFPDGELVPISEMLTTAEAAGFEVRDVESLREHYAMTLRHWVRRLEDHAEEAIHATDPESFRVWRLFMAGSAYSFDAGNIGLHQALLHKPTAQGPSTLPLTRADLYA